MSGGARCRWCDARIRWVPTAGGSNMPLNIDPDPTGNVLIEHGTVHVLNADEQARRIPGTRWMPHQATCTGRPRGGRR